MTVSYGVKSSFSLLLQYGFILPGPPSRREITFVNIESLLEAAARSPALSATLAREATIGSLHVDRFGNLASLQPLGAKLQSAVERLATARLLPPQLHTCDDSDATLAAAMAYAQLLRLTLSGYTTTAADDVSALRLGDGETLLRRHRLALEFRLQQKQMLQAALEVEEQRNAVPLESIS